MLERRVLFTLAVTYQTPYEKLQIINTMLRHIIESQPQTRFDRAHFKEYGDSGLIYEVAYYVTSADYNLYMDIQQAINLEIFRQFQEAGIEFAHPTRRLYLHQESQVVHPSGSGQAHLEDRTSEVRTPKNS
jgi:small-conductance mechanosensitive channel